MDPNWIIAIISITSIIFPTACTLINNHYQLQLQKLQLFEAIEKFIKSSEYYYYHKGINSAKIDFESSISNLFIYFSIPKYLLFDKLKECINSNEYDKTQFAISEIVKILSSQLEK